MNSNVSKTTKVKSVADYISIQIGLCGKSQLVIASEAGFDKPNIITMIKQGKTKLPLDKIGKFAKAIEVDAVHLYRICMTEYMPETWGELQKIIGQPILSHNELDFIEVIRQSNIENPKLKSDEDKQRFMEFVNTLRGD